MNITYLGHAGYKITTSSNKKILIDPWFNSAFLGSWTPFPPNRHLEEDLKNSDYILLSHEHEDHCDIKFLNSTRSKIFIPEFRSNSFRIKLGSNNLSFTEIEPRKPFVIENLEITFVIQSSPAWDDSAIIIKDLDTNKVFANLNDLKPSASDVDYIRRNFPKVNYLSYQYSGASWHPMCNLEIPKHERQEVIQRKIQNKFTHTVKLINEFQPEFVLPAAGPPVFLSVEHVSFNNSKVAVFPYVDEYIEFLKKNKVHTTIKALLPGDSLDIERKGKIIDTREEYVSTNKRKQEFKSIELSFEHIKLYFEKNFKDLGSFKNVLNFNINYYIKDLNITISTNPRLDIITKDQILDSHVDFILNSSIMNDLINYKITWEEAFLSLFVIQNWKIKFNEFIITYHKYLHSSYLKNYLANLKGLDRNEYFQLNIDGKVKKVQRLCPHAQGDLSKGIIKDGCLVCPNHGWRFDIETGECLDSNSRISIKSVDN